MKVVCLCVRLCLCFPHEHSVCAAAKTQQQICPFLFVIRQFWDGWETKEGAPSFIHCGTWSTQRGPPTWHTPLQGGPFGATNSTNAFKRKMKTEGIVPWFPPTLVLSQHAIKCYQEPTVWLRSTWWDCQSDWKPPHAIMHFEFLCRVGHDTRGSCLERVKLRILYPGPESGTAVYDMKGPYVKSSLI